MADWVSIKAEYISTDISTRALAEKHGVSASALMKHSAAEKWGEERKKQVSKVEAKVKQRIASVAASHEVDRITRLLSIGDKLSAKLDEAAGQLDRKMVTHKRKVKTTEKPKDGAWTETTVEEEILEVVDAPLDRQGIKLLASALKDLNDIAATPKTDEQSLSKVAEMMSRLDKEAAADAVPE